MLNKKISQVNFTFLDVETTGLCPNFGDRICELALLQYQDGQILETFHTLINPGRPISPGARAVTGIDDLMVKNAPRFYEIVQELIRLIKDRVIVGHNVTFDVSFINAHLASLYLAPVDNILIDTLALARKCYNFTSNSLGNIVTSLALPLVEEHRALGDVKMTKDIFENFLKDFQSKNIEQLEQLIALQGGEIVIPEQDKIILPPAIEEAIKNKTQVYIKYVDAQSQETSRIIEPKEVVAIGDYTYVVAFCRFKETELKFRLDRIIEFKALS